MKEFMVLDFWVGLKDAAHAPACQPRDCANRFENEASPAKSGLVGAERKRAGWKNKSRLIRGAFHPFIRRRCCCSWG
jgi:hypothetical protein